jgi:8-hydroxy-5-deazaflavin:NADPH oxidoreductase
MMAETRLKIAVIGGSGALGRALAIRLARAGVATVIGSRTQDKARETAAAVASEADSASVTGLDNAAAAEDADLVILAVPFASQGETLRVLAPGLEGKIVVDTTVPLVPPKVARVQLPESGSAALAAAQILGPGVRVVSAFHNISAHKLATSAPVDCDILVFGDDVEARDTVLDLIGSMGLNGLHGGPLANSVAAEAMTSVLISINRRYKVEGGAGIRITGIGSTD